MPFKVKVETYAEGIYVLKPEGSIDADSDTSFYKEVEPLLENARVLLFDMTRLEYIDSTGLASVLKIRKLLENSGGSLIAAGLRPRIKDIFTVVKIIPDDLVFEDLRKACDHIDNNLGAR